MASVGDVASVKPGVVFALAVTLEFGVCTRFSGGIGRCGDAVETSGGVVTTAPVRDRFNDAAAEFAACTTAAAAPTVIGILASLDSDNGVFVAADCNDEDDNDAAVAVVMLLLLLLVVAAVVDALSGAGATLAGLPGDSDLLGLPAAVLVGVAGVARRCEPGDTRILSGEFAPAAAAPEVAVAAPEVAVAPLFAVGP